MTYIQQFLSNEEGVTAVEYAIMLALIAGVCIAAIFLVGDAAAGMWNDSSGDLGDTFDEIGVGQ